MKRLLTALTLVCLSSCAIAPFPNEKLYVVDLVNGVCAEYEIVNVEEIKFRWVRDLALNRQGPCDRMAGFSRDGFKNVQNWIRDVIAKEKRK